MQTSLPLTPQRLRLVFVLAASVVLSILLVAGRVLLTGRLTFAFLLWNLVLAAIPFVLSAALSLATPAPPARLLLPVGAAWLLFFPNVLYIITNLFHFQQRPGAPFWYDLALIISCAGNGLLLAYTSLSDMQQLVQRRMGTGTGWAFATLALLLSSFGIYLGSYLRSSSWNVLANPLTLFFDIVNRVLHPFSFPGTWGVTLVFGVFLLVGYGTVRRLNRAPDGPVA